MRSSCRPASVARIRKRVVASNTAGWPVKVRDILLQTENLSSRLRRPALRSFGHGPTSTAKSRPIVRPRPQIHGGRLASIPNQVGQAGAVRTVEVELEFETPQQQPRLAATPSSRHRRRPPRIPTGQPTVSAVPASYRIRANDAGRHENRNDKNELKPSAKALPCRQMLQI